MPRKLSILLVLIFMISLTGQAQDAVEIFGGYSYERFGSSPGSNLNGVEISGKYKFANWLGAVGDFDTHFGSPFHIDNRTLDFLVGPQVSFPARISPFVHALIGIGHIRTSGVTDTSLATAIGGGIDLRVAPFFSWRVIQADDVVTRFFNGKQNSARISTGLVFRF